MTEEEIRELAASKGLDPKGLKICEPWHDQFLRARRYRLEYRWETRMMDWNFVVSDEEVKHERFSEGAIRFYVYEELQAISEVVHA